MSILVIILVIIILIVISIKFKELRHKFLYTFIAVTVAFFAFTFIYIFIKSGVDMTSYKGFVEAGKIYVSWLASAVRNLGSATGYLVNQNWGVNLTNVTG